MERKEIQAHSTKLDKLFLNELVCVYMTQYNVLNGSQKQYHPVPEFNVFISSTMRWFLFVAQRRFTGTVP